MGALPPSRAATTPGYFPIKEDRAASGLVVVRRGAYKAAHDWLCSDPDTNYLPGALKRGDAGPRCLMFRTDPDFHQLIIEKDARDVRRYP